MTLSAGKSEKSICTLTSGVAVEFVNDVVNVFASAPGWNDVGNVSLAVGADCCMEP